MTRVLFYEPAYRRIEQRIAHLPSIEAVMMDREGKIVSGEPVENIEVGWATSDLFGGPIRAYMIALLKSLRCSS